MYLFCIFKKQQHIIDEYSPQSISGIKYKEGL